MKIAIGSDHAGFSLKEVIKKHLEEEGYEVSDKGTHDTASCQYPSHRARKSSAVSSAEQA